MTDDPLNFTLEGDVRDLTIGGVPATVDDLALHLSNSVGTTGADLTVEDMQRAWDRLKAFEQRRDDAYAESMAFIRDHFPGRDPNDVIAEAVNVYLRPVGVDLAGLGPGESPTITIRGVWVPAGPSPRRVRQRAARKIRMARKRRRGYA